MGRKRPTTRKKMHAVLWGFRFSGVKLSIANWRGKKKKKEAKADKYCFILTSILNEEVKIKASVCEAGLVNCQ